MIFSDEETKKNSQRKVSVIGLGYVGLPVCVAFGSIQKVIGFDINPKRINLLREGVDVTGEISSEELKKTNIYYTTDPSDLSQADFHIIAVPSPINQAKHPDFSHLADASVVLGKYLKKNDIVVYESTVYPGATEEKCIPLLEAASGLISGKDFFVGYSPERINPGDKERTFTKIKKVVSAQTIDALEIVAETYNQVVQAGVHKVSSIKVAEAAKVIENTQRDINIALINELALIFNKLNIDTEEVLSAAGTKWNFLPFKPGLVGGHCIGVDPYYLTHKAIECGVHPEVILAGRRINDGMGKYIAEQTIKQISRLGKKTKDARIGILGLTFKENCTDIRNSKVVDIVNELISYHADVKIHDPKVNVDHAKHEYGFDLTSWEDFKDLDAMIFAVPHNEFRAIHIEELHNRLSDPKLIIDIKSVLPYQEMIKHGVKIWRL